MSLTAGGVLFLCTGNQCRSPMAAGLLRSELDRRGNPLAVSSAGFVSPGMPPPPEVLKAMADAGVDLGGHLSQLVTPESIRRAKLVIGMTRQHVMDLVEMAPDSWPRTFSVAELEGRLEQVPPDRTSVELDRWVEHLSAGRARADLLRVPLQADVADPMGKRYKAFVQTRDRLSRFCVQLASRLPSA